MGSILFEYRPYVKFILFHPYRFAISFRQNTTLSRNFVSVVRLFRLLRR